MPTTSKVIDAHAHVGRFGSWANVSCAPEELLEKMDSARVEKAVLFAPDNLLVRKAVRSHPKRFVGYVWPNPHDKGALSLVTDAVKRWGFRGIKLHPLVHAFLPTDDEVLPIVEFAGKERIPVAIHSGHPPFSLPWSIGELAELYPDVRVVMLHMGHAHGVYIQAAINTRRDIRPSTSSIGSTAGFVKRDSSWRESSVRASRESRRTPGGGCFRAS